MFDETKAYFTCKCGERFQVLDDSKEDGVDVETSGELLRQHMAENPHE